MKFAATHRNINKILAIICLVFGLYLTLTPLVPIKASNDFPSGKVITPISVDTQLKDQPDYLEFLTGPSIKSEILEGDSIRVINRGGLWRVASSSADPDRSNMVIVGHNFTYENSYPPFRSLPSTREGDSIRLVYKNSIYNYRVVKASVHQPNDLFVEQPTEKPTLTLYTCYPMFMSKERFVVTAEQI